MKEQKYCTNCGSKLNEEGICLNCQQIQKGKQETPSSKEDQIASTLSAISLVLTIFSLPLFCIIVLSGFFGEDVFGESLSFSIFCILPFLIGIVLTVMARIISPQNKFSKIVMIILCVVIALALMLTYLVAEFCNGLGDVG